jgi:hypothetical protein
LIEYVDKTPNTPGLAGAVRICAITAAKSRLMSAKAGLSPDRQTRYELEFAGSDGTQRLFGGIHGSQDEF